MDINILKELSAFRPAVRIRHIIRGDFLIYFSQHRSPVPLSLFDRIWNLERVADGSYGHLQDSHQMKHTRCKSTKSECFSSFRNIKAGRRTLIVNLLPEKRNWLSKHFLVASLDL